MPVFPYNRLSVDPYWPHVVMPGRRVRELQKLARIFVAWADSRFPKHYSPVLLAAGVVSVEDLQRLLARVAQALLTCCPPVKWGEQRKLATRSQKNLAPDDPHVTLSRALNALLYHKSVLAFADDADVFVFADDDEDDSPIDAFTRHSLGDTALQVSSSVRRALTHLRSSDTKALLPQRDESLKAPSDAETVTVSDAASRRAWHTALEDAMRLAVRKFDEVIVRYGFHRFPSGTGAVQRNFTAACKAIREMAESRTGFTAGEWFKAAVLLQRTADSWKIHELRHHVTGDDQTAQKLSVNIACAYVFQYATLMRGNSQISAVVTQIAYLRNVCATIASIECRGTSDPKAVSSEDYESYLKVLARMDRSVLPTGALERWRDTLRTDAVIHGRFISEVATPKPSKRSVPQTVRWGMGERIDAYKRISPRAKTNPKDGSFKDVFVNDCLMALQRLGLAARIPDDLWRRARELEAAQRAGADARKVRPLKTYVSKRWIVNPLGAALALSAERGGA